MAKWLVDDDCRERSGRAWDKIRAPTLVQHLFGARRPAPRNAMQ
jgi:hypothetical protein